MAERKVISFIVRPLPMITGSGRAQLEEAARVFEGHKGRLEGLGVSVASYPDTGSIRFDLSYDPIDRDRERRGRAIQAILAFGSDLERLEDLQVGAKLDSESLPLMTLSAWLMASYAV